MQRLVHALVLIALAVVLALAGMLCGCGDTSNPYWTTPDGEVRLCDQRGLPRSWGRQDVCVIPNVRSYVWRWGAVDGRSHPLVKVRLITRTDERSELHELASEVATAVMDEGRSAVRWACPGRLIVRSGGYVLAPYVGSKDHPTSYLADFDVRCCSPSIAPCVWKAEDEVGVLTSRTTQPLTNCVEDEGGPLHEGKDRGACFDHVSNSPFGLGGPHIHFQFVYDVLAMRYYVEHPDRADVYAIACKLAKKVAARDLDAPDVTCGTMRLRERTEDPELGRVIQKLYIVVNKAEQGSTK